MQTNSKNHRDGSVAVWCTSKAGADGSSIEAHFNFWRIAGVKNFVRTDNKQVSDLLEIGLMVTNAGCISALHVYLPSEIDRDCLTDCGPFLKRDEINQGIFNEKLTCVTVPREERFELKMGDEHSCYVYEFRKANELIVEEQLTIRKDDTGGTFLTINESAIRSASAGTNKGHRIYFRLRVSLTEVSGAPFIRVIPPVDQNFQSGFEVIDYIDFRFNETRTLPRAVEERMAGDNPNGVVPVTKLAFLAALPMHSNISATSVPYHKNRLLEFEPWNSYIPGGIPNGMVVHHWKRPADNKSDNQVHSTGFSKGLVENGKQPADRKFESPPLEFSCYVKLQTRQSAKLIIAKYLGIAFAFGLLGNIVASSLVYGFGILWSYLMS